MQDGGLSDAFELIRSFKLSGLKTRMANLEALAEEKTKADLVSCPGHNVIASDPSQCCETVSKVAAGNRRTASGVG